MNTKSLLSLLTFILLSVSTAFAQEASPVGIWKTIDDKTSEAKSHIEVYEQDGKLFGKIVKLLISSPEKICMECTGDKKNKPLIGLVIVEDLQSYKDYWKKGIIMDPEDGKEYGCSVWFEEGKRNELKVRGKHWTGIYRTQTWYRVE